MDESSLQSWRRQESFEYATEKTITVCSPIFYPENKGMYTEKKEKNFD